MRGLFLSAIFFLGAQVSANTVLIQSTQSSRNDYRAMLRADAEYVSPTESYLNGHPLLSNRETLLTRFAEAQTAFLEKSIGEAQAKFREVTALVTTDDWAKSDREVFLHAYYRLAQMENDAKKSEAVLAESLGLGAGLNVEQNLFPPPLIQKRAQLLKSGEVISRKNFGPSWTHVMINGQACDANQCGKWPKLAGKVRVTFISDQYQPQVIIADISKVEGLRPKTVALAEGNCQKTRYSEAAEAIGRKRVFWGLDCDKKEAVAMKLSPGSSAAPVANTSTLPSFPKDDQKPFYKNAWFWAGVGGAVVAFIVISNSQQKSEKETTTTYGLSF